MTAPSKEEREKQREKTVSTLMRQLEEANREVGEAFAGFAEAAHRFGANPGDAALAQTQARVEESRYKHQTAVQGLRDQETRDRQWEAEDREDEAKQRETRLEQIAIRSERTARLSMWAMAAAAFAAGMAAIPPFWALVKEVLGLLGVKIG